MDLIIKTKEKMIEEEFRNHNQNLQKAINYFESALREISVRLRNFDCNYYDQALEIIVACRNVTIGI